MKKINTPLGDEDIESLKAGDELLLNGIIYTARDQAHKRFIEVLDKNLKTPVDLKSAVIYYCGPTDSRRTRAIGACGPTTSSRMDEFTPDLIKAGLRAMIGKGARSKKVTAAIKKYKAVYFLTYAGCGALLSKYIRRSKVVAYKDLGPEAVYKLEIKDFPVIVGIDSRGRSIL